MAGEVPGKRCTGCEQTSSPVAFARDENRSDGPQMRCRECAAECGAADCRRRRGAITRSVRQWHRDATASGGLSTRREARRETRGRQHHLKRDHGITQAEPDELLAARAGVCCIRLTAPAIHVDHCHDTGRVRGVLCFSCNAALGQFKDRPDAIRRAAAYVEGIAWKPTLVAPGVYQLPS
ncbi:endonuclease VII domain-containing protein [Streptomyces phaeoluteigriseus]